MDPVFISPKIADKLYTFMGDIFGSVADIVDPASVVYRDQVNHDDHGHSHGHGHGHSHGHSHGHGHGHFQASGDDKGHYIPLSSGYGALEDMEEPTNHCHSKKRGSRFDFHARKKLILASVLCLVFMIGEGIGGAMAHSLAVVTDAAHLLTDFASFMISLMAIHMASRAPTKGMNFGWYRAEVMGALISVLMIWLVTGILVYLAVHRLIHQNYEIHAEIMVVTAAIGVAFNLVMGLTLHQHSHGHLGHGHSHDVVPKDEYETDVDESDEEEHSHQILMEAPNHGHSHNINVKAAFIHVLGDFCQSVGVLIAAIIVYARPEWKIADPICTFLFSIMVLLTTVNILRDTLHILMEGAPSSVNYNNLRDSFMGVNGVKQVHNLRVWSLTTNKLAMSVHLALDEVEHQYVLKHASRIARRRYGIHDVTIQLEQYTDDMVGCQECMDPPN